MRRSIYLLFIISATMAVMPKAHGQNYDRHWLGIDYDDYYSVAFIRFDTDSIHFLPSGVTSKIFIDSGCIAMSDAEGELQFYTNGNVVVSWDHSIMEGGKGFNQGSTGDDFGVNGADTLWNTNYNPYTYQIIPDAPTEAGDEHIYYMIHAFVLQTGDCKAIDVPKMQISKIDMSANGGKGKVVYKNRYFDEELMAAGFALVRHGNGKDWWVVLRRQDGLAYRSILLHRDSVVQVVPSEIPGLDTSGFSWSDCYWTSGNLLHASLDGSRLLDNYGVENVKLLNFDRCSGEVSLLDTIHVGVTAMVPYPPPNGPLIPEPYVAFQFSQSGRFLYGVGPYGLAQWDLEAADIAASKVKLGGGECPGRWTMSRT